MQLQLQRLLQLHLQHYNYNYINYSYNHTTIQLQLRLQKILCITLYTALHPAIVVDVTTVTTPKSTTPTSFRSINGFALASMHDNNSPLLYIVSYL